MKKVQFDDPWPEARNLLRYDREGCVLSDFHSPVAIGAWNTDAMGIMQLYFQGYAPSAENEVMDPLLRLFAQTTQDGEWQPIPVSERTCWPGGWIEKGCLKDTELTQYIWFTRHNELRIHVVLEASENNASPIKLALAGGHAFSSLLLNGEISNERLQVHIESKGRNKKGTPDCIADMYIATEPQWESCRFRRSASQNSLAPTESELSDTSEPNTHFGYWMELSDLEIGHDKPGEIGITLNWEFSNVSITDTSQRYGFEENIKRWRSTVETLPLPENNTYWRRKAILATSDLLISLIQSPGYGNMEEKLGIGARTLGTLSYTYFWDTMTTVPVIAQLDSDWGAQLIENFTQFLGDHDCPPFAINAFPDIRGEKRSWRGSQAPIASWAIEKLAICTGQADLHERLYPELKKIHNSWFDHADPDGNGIPVWVNTGAVFDNSPLFDMYGGSDDWYNIYLPPLVSVCLCSYLLMDMRCLKSMATRLERHEEAAEWQHKLEGFEKRMLEMLWDDEEKIFFDLDMTVYKPTKVKTFFNLLPLWAGISMPEEDAQAAIEKHLLNSDELWGDIPFPSVAFNEPTYDPFGYCRGRGWPHIYFWNTEILAKYGYTKEANEAKRRYLSMLADTIDIPENFVSGICLKNRHDHGFPHYSWGLSATLFFLWDWHLKTV
jgi:hypothetical protein